MKQKKGICAFCPVCILIAAALMGVFLLQVRESNQVLMAENCGQ